MSREAVIGSELKPEELTLHTHWWHCISFAVSSVTRVCAVLGAQWLWTTLQFIFTFVKRTVKFDYFKVTKRLTVKAPADSVYIEETGRSGPPASSLLPQEFLVKC